MTVPSEVVRNGPFTPNGVTRAFPFTFRALEADDVQVMRALADGSQVSVSDSDYSVTLTDSGGTVTFYVAPTGAAIYIQLDPLFSQNISLENEGAFLPEVITEALDRGAQRALWLRDRVSRALVLPIGSGSGEVKGIVPGQFIAIGPDGSPIGASGTGADAGLRTDLAAANGGAIVNVTLPGVGGMKRDTATILKRTIDVVDYGAKLDATFNGVVWSGTDDTQAWRNAIAAAAALGIQEIVCSGGVTGVSFVTGSIVSGPMPPNLRFRGLARDLAGGGAGSGYNSGPSICYTGSGSCWDINYEAGVSGGLPGETGNWTWENLTFITTNVNGTVFEFNRCSTTTRIYEGGDGGASYLRGVRFIDCQGFGAYGNAAQTGDFVRGGKLFELWANKGCMIRGFRRGFWLRGCDNTRIEARLTLNGRHVMMVRENTFGSWAKITSDWMGNGIYCGESTYHIWDNTTNTLILNTALEQVDAGRTALLYLDGSGQSLYSAGGAGCPIFEVGPNCRDLLIDNFGLGISPDGWKPIIALPNTAATSTTPTSNDWGYEQLDLRIKVRNANYHMQKLCGTHPRIQYVDANPGANARVPLLPGAVVDANGVRNRALTISARAYWGKSFGTPSIGGTKFAQDAAAHGGWAIWLDRTVPGSGFHMQLTAGLDFQPGDLVQFVIRSRSAAGATGWAYAVLRNGSFSALAGFPQTASYGMAKVVIDTTGWARGDSVLMGIVQAATPSADLYVDSIRAEIVSAPIADPTDAATTQSAVVALLAAARRFGIIGG